jgi:hypothetical protein
MSEFMIAGPVDARQLVVIVSGAGRMSSGLASYGEPRA